MSTLLPGVRRVDSQLGHVVRLRRPARRREAGRDVHWQLDGDPGALQAVARTVRRHVQAQGLPPLVPRRGYGRDGVQRG